MQAGKPSRTALAAAAHRAAHQVLEHGRIFADPLALTILGDEADALVQRSQEHPASAGIRMFIAARTRFAEDALAAAVERGARQLVVLGAGLDTYAYRGSACERVHVFEVDHPATQAWKRERLAAVGIPVPRWGIPTGVASAASPSGGSRGGSRPGLLPSGDPDRGDPDRTDVVAAPARGIPTGGIPGDPDRGCFRAGIRPGLLPSGDPGIPTGVASAASP